MNDRLLREVNDWTTGRLTHLNREILARRLQPRDLVDELNLKVLQSLPDPQLCGSPTARRLIVHMGLWGSSVGRHLQERDPSLKLDPAHTLNALSVGDNQLPFLQYFSAMAARAGDGHASRDTYASLVRWNTPAVEVRVMGRTTRLPGAFDDLDIRTYTGDQGEKEFFTLLKKSEAVELAANDLIEPLCDGSISLLGSGARNRLAIAALLLSILHRLNLDFPRLPCDRALSAEHFMDKLRQFAIHWTAGDVPPSGAEDVQFLYRDFLLGINFRDYGKHVRRVFPVLLESERVKILSLMNRPTLPNLVLRALRLTPDTLGQMTEKQLRAVVHRYPVLASCYLLLFVNTRVSGVHLMLTEKFLFHPQARRDAAGIPDGAVVSNRAGTTGLVERMLRRLNEARRDHPLRPLGKLPTSELIEATGMSYPRVNSDDVADAVRYVR